MYLYFIDLIKVFKSPKGDTDEQRAERFDKEGRFGFNNGLKKEYIIGPLLFNFMVDETIQNWNYQCTPYKTGYRKMEVIEVTELSSWKRSYFNEIS